MFHGDAAATDNVFYDYDVGYSDIEFDIRKFHGDVAGFDNVDDDSYNYDDNDSDVFDARKIHGDAGKPGIDVDDYDYDDEGLSGMSFMVSEKTTKESMIIAIIETNAESLHVVYVT